MAHIHHAMSNQTVVLNMFNLYVLSILTHPCILLLISFIQFPSYFFIDLVDSWLSSCSLLIIHHIGYLSSNGAPWRHGSEDDGAVLLLPSSTSSFLSPRERAALPPLLSALWNIDNPAVPKLREGGGIKCTFLSMALTPEQPFSLQSLKLSSSG